MTDPFVYIAPNEHTTPRYTAIRARADQTRAEVIAAIGADRSSAYRAINSACESLYATIIALAPASADRAAAERCCRLARMAANERVTAAPEEHARLDARILDEIDGARWQACAAIALAPVESLPALPELSTP